VNAPFAAARRIFLVACLLPGLVFLNPHEARAAGSPRAELSSSVDEVIRVLSDKSADDESKRRRVVALVDKRFDFREMTKRVLATNWRSANKEQRRAITKLFRELLSNTYWRRMAAYKGEQVSYTGEAIRDDIYATVNTAIATANGPIPVDYKLHLKKKKDTWMVYDVVIEQVSLVRNYRGEFYDIVKNKGIDGLIVELERKAAQTGAVPTK
jgi:phospholipid transport system substrate-binding protein